MNLKRRSFILKIHLSQQHTCAIDLQVMNRTFQLLRYLYLTNQKMNQHFQLQIQSLALTFSTWSRELTMMGSSRGSEDTMTFSISEPHFCRDGRGYSFLRSHQRKKLEIRSKDFCLKECCFCPDSSKQFLKTTIC